MSVLPARAGVLGFLAAFCKRPMPCCPTCEDPARFRADYKSVMLPSDFSKYCPSKIQTGSHQECGSNCNEVISKQHVDVLRFMKLSRPSRIVAALIALVSILFMQLAVAAYACPTLTTGNDSLSIPGPVGIPDFDSTPCHDIDPVEPSLCHAYDQSGNQSLDKPAAPPLQPFTAIGFGLPWRPLDVTFRPSFFSPATAFLTHAAAPPLAIRNCCLRI